jgi:phosphatidylserine decarboxylase
MKGESPLARLFQHESVNFAVTNRIPRRTLTRFANWFCRIEQPVVRDVSLWVWQLFGGDLNLQEAKKSSFSSLQDCFVRELRDGARPIDATPGVLVSPCDAIVGQCGPIQDNQLLQAKGIDYTLEDLLLDSGLAQAYRGGVYATLRLTSTMYHRFHAPYDCRIDSVAYVAGDTWNVNPATLRRVPRVFCRNERAVLSTRLEGSLETVALVPVAAILVAGIHLSFANTTFNLTYQGPQQLACSVRVRKGQEIGHFRHGSTIVVLGSAGLELDAAAHEGHNIRMGQPLFRHR